MPAVLSDFTEKLNNIAELGLTRQRRVRTSAQAPLQRQEGKGFVAFNSNDYLGLANDKRIIASFTDAAHEFGVGSGSANTINGYTSLHAKLEEKIAEWTGFERALLFSTGYMANLAVLATLNTNTDIILQDKLNHASLLDAGKLSNAKSYRYKHKSLDSLAQQLQKHSNASTMVVSESIFSMDGDSIDLNAIIATIKAFKTKLIIDDAHGLGVLGNNGAGVCEAQNINRNDVMCQIGAFGKAMGTFGAFVAASHEAIEYLLQFARTYLYTTATPPALAAATYKAIEICQQEHFRREQLQENINYFCTQAHAYGIELGESTSAIQPIIVGANAKCCALANALYEEGFLTTAIRPPTVAANTARLRITLTSGHTKTQIANLLAAIEKYYVT